jgi:hypothetical protein
VLLRDPLVQVLALKLSKLADDQSGIPLNIPPMAQNFGGPEVNHRRHLTEMAHEIAPTTVELGKEALPTLSR